jgi:long-subunit acyl-CoA synthetase (AMP-forming)
MVDDIAPVSERPPSMARMLLDGAAATPDREAFRYPVGERWESLDWRQVGERTATALSAGGWLHTGDVGELDEDGFLRITDQMKDLIKTSGGKYVAPQRIETAFKALCPYASEIVVHGDGRPYCVALIALDPEAIGSWARENKLGHLLLPKLAAQPQVRALIAGPLEKTNRGLPRWETVKRFAILQRALTVEDGDLTPTLKLKRRAVTAKHPDLLDALYDIGSATKRRPPQPHWPPERTSAGGE